jgi:hypothetical protein
VRAGQPALILKEEHYMATKTNIEVKANLQFGSILVQQGCYILEDHVAASDLQAEIDADSPHVTVLGTVEVVDEAAVDVPATDDGTVDAGATNADGTPAAGSKKRAPKA